MRKPDILDDPGISGRFSAFTVSEPIHRAHSALQRASALSPRAKPQALPSLAESFATRAPAYRWQPAGSSESRHERAYCDSPADVAAPSDSARLARNRTRK